MGEKKIVRSPIAKCLNWTKAEMAMVKREKAKEAREAKKLAKQLYVPRTFQWYKELFNPMGFDPCNRSLKIQESIRIPTPKVGVHLGVWRFNSPTLLYFQPPGNMNCDYRASLLARAFTTPCLGRKPKARVATLGSIKKLPTTPKGENEKTFQPFNPKSGEGGGINKERVFQGGSPKDNI
jgi:hypothetical protein